MARRSDHTRDEIKAMAIASAVRILMDEGAAALSARRVAKDIGYTVGTLYLVFQNLDELILHINAATLTELERKLMDACQNSLSPSEQIMAIARGYWEFAHGNYARWSLLFRHQLPEGSQIPDWFVTKVRNLFSLLERPLSQICPAVNKTVLIATARALWGGVHGVCELALSDKLRWGEQIADEEVIRTLVETFLAGLIKETGELHA